MVHLSEREKIMEKFYLEEPGVLLEFCPEELTMTTYVYEEIDSVYEAKGIQGLRNLYKAKLHNGFKVYDPNIIIGSEPIYKSASYDLIIDEKNEEMEREEFFTPHPDDWAYK
jgi:hypothetical protein